jgi:hypothetical protein
MQILLADLMVGTNNPALQDRPEAFDCVRMNRANNMLPDGVINGLVRKTMLQPHIAGISIGAEKADAIRDGFANKSLKGVAVGPLDNARNDVALALNCPNNSRLAGVAPADIGFVNFYDPAEFLDVLDHGSSDLVAHKPSGFVRSEAHVAEDLEGAHAFLADQHKVGDAVPIFERFIRVLKDCPGQVREAIALVCARIALPMKSHCRDWIDSLRAATRTADALGPSPCDQVSDAIFLSLKERVELRGGQLMDWLRMLSAGHDGLLFDRKETLA